MEGPKENPKRDSGEEWTDKVEAPQAEHAHPEEEASLAMAAPMGVVFPLGGVVEEPRYTPLFVVQTSG
jgi:hypothetical protein